MLCHPVVRQIVGHLRLKRICFVAQFARVSFKSLVRSFISLVVLAVSSAVFLSEQAQNTRHERTREIVFFIERTLLEEFIFPQRKDYL